jgi:hypothetical protein
VRGPFLDKPSIAKHFSKCCNWKVLNEFLLFDLRSWGRWHHTQKYHNYNHFALILERFSRKGQRFWAFSPFGSNEVGRSRADVHILRPINIMLVHFA